MLLNFPSFTVKLLSVVEYLQRFYDTTISKSSGEEGKAIFQ